MATILLSAAGAALGAGFGGTLLGLSGAVIGRALGATLGRVIDQRVMGNGSDAVDVGRVERFRLMGASEGAALPRLWGRVRVSGQVIWATRFQEQVTRAGGSKGAPRGASNQFSYSISLAIGLCEGRITHVGRVWADGNEVSPDTLNMRVYHGDETQLPDPKIEAVEGAGLAPAYRGTAYVVIEDLDLAAYGNRVPQFSFEVIRPAQGEAAAAFPDLAKTVPGVALIPGTGEYALATTSVHYSYGPGVNRSANVNTAAGKADLLVSLNQLRDELPAVAGLSLVVSWFGGDLRCGSCQIKPKVEQTQYDGVGMTWKVSGMARAAATTVPQDQGKPIYGGTPADQSVVEAIQAIRAGGQEVTFYPFILMDQIAGNTLPDPYSDATQPHLPWRGRITLAKAPGRPGSTDRSAAAEAEVAAFFGAALPSHFTASGTDVSYNGPADWGYRRFVLHYAKLCAAAGGVDTFCIGSELRGLTQIRAAADSFPAVAALRALAADVRAILGAGTKITYAADWTEYFGYHTGDNVYFHLDPLWADPAIDLIGIDNYMPLSDWRDGETHADAAWGAIHNKDYLRANIAGGEGFDWYYDGPEGAAAQLRKPITDGAYDEPWVYRYKDLRGWWQNQHHNRIAGARDALPTAWVPASKPIRFIEYGCAALDKATNEPNKLLDFKSSESGLPNYSDGHRDDLIQLVYFQAMAEHWADPANNPVSPVYAAPMVDFGKSLAWAWDARPFPDFPRNTQNWGDAANYDKGHWLNGRTSGQQLAAVMAEVCQTADLSPFGFAEPLGLVRGYGVHDIATARAILQPLMLAHGVEVIEREGAVAFKKLTGLAATTVSPDSLARSSEIDGVLETSRLSHIETPGRVRLTYLESEGDFSVATVQAIFPDEAGDVVSQSELPLVLTEAEATTIAERWMAEARVARDVARFALPPSQLGLGAGDVVMLEDQRYRIDRIEQSGVQLVEAVRIDPAPYRPTETNSTARTWPPHVPPTPVHPVFLDLPLLTGAEVPHAPFIAAVAQPWPGSVALWASATDDSYALNKVVSAPAVIGITETPLSQAPAGLWDRGAALRVRVETGALSSATTFQVLAGANVAAIGDGSAAGWEVFQFATATLVAPKTYELSLRLRGQAGSDGIMPPEWPIGSTVVLLTAALAQIDLPAAARGLVRNYRIGAANRGYDAPEGVHLVESFDGIGLRPYPVAHLRATQADADLHLNWTRRTRIDGDSWQSVEVPLGEDAEAYIVRVLQGATLLRETTTTSASWIYSAAQQSADTASGPITLSVAQLSQRFGAGPFRSIDVTL